MNSNKELNSLMLYQLDNGIYHKDYSDEFSFYELVKTGNIEEIKKYNVLHIDENSKGYGKLSDDTMRNLTYHFVILAAMLARTCTEGGMSREKAYSLSDLYIRTADKCKNVETLKMLHEEMILDYTMRMKYIYREKIYSKNVIECLSIIEKNLNRYISAEELAEKIGINRSYLSRLFKQEVGVPLSEYISRQKIDAAEAMLKLSNRPAAEIAAYFGFSSQSHFIQVFKKYKGKTPNKV